MKNKIMATICCSVLSCALYAQNGWLPPVNIPANANACDASPWKLVMYDEFNGTQLNANNWKKYTTWNGMNVYRNGISISKPDHSDWGDARKAFETSLYKEENIVISNGTCKLLLKNDPNSTWHYVDSTRTDYRDSTLTRDLTGATITTPYNKPDGSPNYFNSGKFESRIRFPSFDGAWCAFWLWNGSGVNELDMAEAWGGNGWWGNLWQNRRHIIHSMHAWGPGENQPNPYNLPDECNVSGYNYPNQNWYNYLNGTYFNQSIWHTYAYEWDTASIKTFLDHNHIHTEWKYYQDRQEQYWEYQNGNWNYITYNYRVGSGCNPDAGAWQVTYGYPYNSASNSQLRLNAAFGNDAVKDYNFPYVKGQLEIDYVKIWQKHPELDNHTELCAASTYPNPIITGPSEICGQVSFTASPAVAGATWSSFDNNILHIGNNNLSTSGCDVYKDQGGAFNLGSIKYNYGNGISTCPLKVKSKGGLYCNQSTDWKVVAPQVIFSTGMIAKSHFIAELYYKRDVENGSTPLVSWNVSVNAGTDVHDNRTATQYTLYGQYASIQDLALPSDQPYNIRWKLNVKDASGTYSRSGERNSKTALLQQVNDTNTYYVNAFIDDQDEYDYTVYAAMANQTVSEEEANDSLFMKEMLEKIKVEALQPYLIIDEAMVKKTPSFNNLSKNENNTERISSQTKVYPNPVLADIIIVAGSTFINNQIINIKVYDLTGKLIKTLVTHYQKGNVIKINTEDIQAGNYILELQQVNNKERIKFTKASGK